MELGGNGGFTGYRRFPQPNSGMMRVADICMGLPSKMNHNPSSTAAYHIMDGECTVREQDRFMPIANVIRIMRKILPPHAKISDDAKETIQECVSKYISFITGEANELCQREQRKTITAEDVLWAMSKLGFDECIEPLTLSLRRYREFDGGERGSLRGDPLGKRAIDPAAASLVIAPYLPSHFRLAHHPAAGFFSATPINGFLKDPSSNEGDQASSQAAAVANGGHEQQPFGQCKE